MNSSPEHMVLIDGNSLINRAFFALAGRSPLRAPDGTPTGALHGFLNMLLKYLAELDADHVVVAFDRREPTFRHEQYKEYKGTRKGMPDDLAAQIPLVKDLLEHMGIARVELAGYEADDLLGTLAARSRNAGWNVTIITGDRDAYQLIRDGVTLLLPVTRSGQTTSERYDTARIWEEYGIRPEQFVDVKAIMGDSSDNIPGVKGIGEKGALELIREYGTLEQVYDALDALRPAQAKKLREQRDQALMSRDLARIECAAPLDVGLEALRRSPPDDQKMGELLERLGMRALMERLDVSAPRREAEPVRVRTDGTLSELSGADVDASAPLLGVCWDEDSVAVAVSDSEVWMLIGAELYAIADLCAAREWCLCGYDLKTRLRREVRHGSGGAEGTLHDCLIAAYLLSHLSGRPDFRRVYEAATGHPLRGGEDGTDTSDRQTSLLDDADSTVAREEAGQQLAQRAVAARECARAQRRLLTDAGLAQLADEIEMPLIPVLAEMERIGFHVDGEALNQLSEEFMQKIGQLEQEIFELCGVTFNLQSPKQLSEVLFDTLGLPGGKKNASGTYSTNADELERLTGQHPVIPLIQEHRLLSKLRSTFVEGLSQVIHPEDGRVHTTFNQAVTSTGRLSSSDPNLQNIPVRAEVGREIRRAFTAEEGWVLLDADYSQIELRLLAHLSEDPVMTDAFRNDADIHRITAAKIFGVSAEDVTGDMRAAAKTVNFSIVYGISAYGLSRDLGISVAEAQRYIDEYNGEYTGVKAYMDGLIRDAYRNGYVDTMLGRRRPLPELTSARYNVRSFGERAAMNTPVQGTAADLMKRAMIRVDTAYRDSGIEARLVLQVHDELIVECRPDAVKEASRILREGMEQVAELSVPLVAEVRSGHSWYDTK